MDELIDKDASKKDVSKNKATSRQKSSTLGRYRAIIIAVGCFLIFDLGVLVLNFYTSFQIDKDAVAINLSGRQRMLSQRTVKGLFAVDPTQQTEARLGQMSDLDELRMTVGLFDSTLRAFKNGAEVVDAHGNKVFLDPAPGTSAQVIVGHALDLWEPYFAQLQPVLKGNFSLEDYYTVRSYALNNNIQLLAFMNDLTNDLENQAFTRAARVRMVQTIGITLALLNFIFILYKFIGQLRKADIEVEAANKENAEILSSVREGLFLITGDFKLGSQISKFSNEIFEHPLREDDDFFDLLRPRVSPKVMTDAREYVELLFSTHVKEALVQSVNPLSEVEFNLRNRLGLEEKRFLSFKFNRVLDTDGSVRHLLLTVQDISQRIELELRLKGERQRSQREFSMLLRAIEADPVMLRDFVQRADESLLAINELLRSTSGMKNERDIVKCINDAARRVHAFKGDAGALGLDTLAEIAHVFESELQLIRETSDNNTDIGNSLLALPITLENLLEKVSAIKGLVAGMQQGSQADEASSRPQPSVRGQGSHEDTLTRLAKTIATEQNKQLSPRINMEAQEKLEANTANLIREIAVQLSRNAIVHGIELPEVRAKLGKPPEGRLEVLLACIGRNNWMLRVCDDGAGFATEKIRAKLLNLGWYTPEQLAAMKENEIISNIFKPGFSTADEVSMHAGRGVGMDLVVENLKLLSSAHLHIHSEHGKTTEFVVNFRV